MKRAIRTCSLLLITFYLVILATCENPAGDSNDEEGEFTISLGNATKSKAAALYPPKDFPNPGDNPTHPGIEDFRFEITFTPVPGEKGEKKEFSFNGTETIGGKVKVGKYTVTMEVYEELDDSFYAHGSATGNPIEIKSGPNPTIHVDLYDATVARAPVIITHPLDGSFYDISEILTLTVGATSPDGGDLSYQWWINTTNSNIGGTDLGTANGAQTANYTPAISASGTYYYYVVVTNTNTSVIGTQTATIASNAAEINVTSSVTVWVDTLSGAQNVPYIDLQTALASTAADGTYTVRIGADQTLPPTPLSASISKDITLKATNPLNPVTIQLSSNGSLFTLNDGVTLTLDDGIILRGRNSTDHGLDNNDSLVKLDTYISPETCTLIMKPGSVITGNYNNNFYGGGVTVRSRGIFIMDGGEIFGNTGANGGGVYNYASPNFTMNNGKIYNNSCIGVGGGGGVQITNDGKFTMHDGEIYDNTRGGIYFQGDFYMNGGKIYGNTTVGCGGGVYVERGTFNMSGGEIYGNSASLDGGGVFLGNPGSMPLNCVFSKTPGAIIYGNVSAPLGNTSATDNGHAIWAVAVSPPNRYRDDTVTAAETLGWTFSTSTETGTWYQ